MLVMLRSGLFLAIVAVVGLLTHGDAAHAGDEPLPERIEFNRDIRPIFSDVCFACHGPDEQQRKGELRLDKELTDSAEGNATGGGKRHSILSPGDPDHSELFRRVSSVDPEMRMPPVEHTRQLSPRQVALIRRWIEQGATWQAHWSLLAPVRPDVPTFAAGSAQAAWVHNPIDAFVLQKLEREGVQPSPDADRPTLIRRASLDLTGLPPTPGEIDAFLEDTSPRAWENVVDRLLASPRYGERMATRWLDAARYADTSGYQSDGERYMWRWRDWVIDAYNRNMPFDQFTVEQLAGDMLAHPTLEQRIATGFNRNLRGNAEGGIVPEEYLVEYTVDRVETTSTVWLGLTLGCTRCHDHKYDPFTQREFYQLFAYFNNVPERGRASKYGNSPPYIAAPTADQQQQLEQLDAQLHDAEQAFAGLQPKIAAAQASWEQSPNKTIDNGWSITRQQVAHFPLDANTDNTAAPDQSQIENQESKITSVAGRINQAATFNGSDFIDAGDVANFGWLDRFTCSAWIRPDEDAGGTILSRMTDAEQGDGWYLMLVNGRVQVHMAKRYLDDALRVETAAPLPDGRWIHLAVAYDGSRAAAGVRIFLDGQPVATTTLLDELNQTFASKEPLRIGGGFGPGGRFHGAIDDVRIHADLLTDKEIAVLAVPETIGELLAVEAGQRTPAQSQKLAAYYLAEEATANHKQAWQRVLQLRRERDDFIEQLPTTMVMEEMSPPRETYVLLRGEYDKHGEPVTGGTPAALPPLADGLPNNRLGFARWLVEPAHPLTARVAVNRYWQMYFGTGLVKTVDDFGSQGEWPTHPEMLDWLATEFMQSGWDVKAMQKQIVMSHTYQQSSKVTPDLLQLDPDNRLLARGPRQRLAAEMVRDQALAVSGLLVEKLGGPSVKPYQPAGLWKELTGAEDYVADTGESLYRRSLYTFWKRTVAPPTMLTFDASGREACSVRETRTNTPLQALTLLNETTFVEAARLLAQRVMLPAGTTPADQLALAFRLATSRQPTTAELRILTDGYEQHLARYRQSPDAAVQLLAIGESPRDPSLDPNELAACTAVCSLILNLDEVITKQ
ncbi:MAG: DUF1553 domain-containing protein [Pirellulales bacterium]